MEPMPTPRFWHDSPLSPGAEIALSESAQRHVAALRLRDGDAITLFDGSGDEWGAELLAGRGRARLTSRRAADRESPLALTLLLGLSAGDRMDYAIQKATELGVRQIVPVMTERSVVRLSAERATRRLAQIGRAHV